ncbi:MAG: aminodeoxychorismate synthase component I [Gammaproteobacteria bacterium]|nr:aminodeoxychorismate synthase component I [Gammaproteobacteria bacterium]
MALCETVAGERDLLEIHSRAPSAYPFLLQSVAGHPQSGRYDILFAHPRAWLALTPRGLEAHGVEARPGDDFFGALSAWVRSERAAGGAPEDLPFAGGWFLFMGYEAARQIEPRVAFPPSPHGLPDALAVRCAGAAIYDRERRATTLVAESAAGLDRLRRDFAAAAGATATDDAAALAEAVDEDPPQRFLDGVRRILDYLRAGDVFQVNLSRAWRARLRPGVGYVDVYRRLRLTNPAPFAGLAAWGGAAVLSSSPERLANVKDGWVQTRPIAGTRPRGQGADEDRRLRAMLIESLKERAEHVMLIDLERNDLGRVCEPGSVAVSELMTVESYAHVHHIVSNVRGRLRAQAGVGEVLRAVFPGGTITGCPKVRAMEIIAELEGVGRGPYTGAMGYISLDGRMDSNILIRSLVVENGRASLRAGAGIVADSQPEPELAETRAKARGLLLALGVPP